MKMCSICGASCEDSAEFCMNCGMKLPVHAAQDIASSEMMVTEEKVVADGTLEEEIILHSSSSQDNLTDPYLEQQIAKNHAISNRILTIALVVLSVIAILVFAAARDAGIRQSDVAEPEIAYPKHTQEPTESFKIKKTNDDLTLSAQGNDSSEPFYGMWCAAYLTEEEADSLVSSMQSQNLPGEVVITSEWENLNPTRYYVETSGRYYSESEANAVLDSVRYYYPDAYIKYTGTNLGG